MMGKKQGWDLLEAGDLRGALRRLDEENRLHRSKATLCNLGIAYLGLGDPRAAKKYLDEAVAEAPSDTGTHALAGIACWILGQRAQTVHIWIEGLESEYRDEAGGMELPLLLFLPLCLMEMLFPWHRQRNSSKRL